MYIYSNLKYIREKLKMSKNAFAEKLDINVSNISRWENKKNGMSLDTALDISEKLHIPLPDLIGNDLRLEENVILDENHKLDVMIQDKSKELTEEGKKALINIIDNLTTIDNK